MKIINLPSEIMFNIFSYCFNINLALVHPIWNRLIKDEDFITDYCMSLTNYDKPNIIFFSYHCNIEKILCNRIITKFTKYNLLTTILSNNFYEQYLTIKSPINWNFYVYNTIIGEDILYNIIINNDIKIKYKKLMKIAIKYNYQKLVNHLLYLSDWTKVDICNYAIVYQQADILKKLLYKYNAEETTDFDINQLIYITINMNSINIFDILFEYAQKYDKLDPDLLSESICHQCYYISTNLIESNKINLTSSNNICIYDAVNCYMNNIVELLLKYPEVDPTDPHHNALELAIKKNNTKAIELILEHPNLTINHMTIKQSIKSIYLINLLNYNNSYVYDVVDYYCKNLMKVKLAELLDNIDISAVPHYNKIINCLITFSDPNIIMNIIKNNYPLDNNTLSFIFAIFVNHIDILEYIMYNYKYELNQYEIKDLISLACRNKKKNLINFILNLDYFNEHNYLLKKLCKYCDYPVIINKLLHYPEIQIDIDDNYPIRNALKYKNKKTFLILFANKNTSKSCNNQYLIRYACQEGMTSIVELLLTSPEVNPGAESNLCIRHATENGNLEIVKILKNHNMVDITANEHEPLKSAITNGYLDIVKELCEDLRINPAITNNKPLRLAIRYKKFEIAEYLLTLPRVDPSVKNNNILTYLNRELTHNINVMSIIRQIAGHKKINPHCDNNILTKIGIDYKDEEVLKILINRNDFNISFDNNYLLFNVIALNYVNLVKEILDKIEFKLDKDRYIINEALEHNNPEILNLIFNYSNLI